MTPARFNEITSRYAALRIAVVGDFCLDRYLEIDPTKQEISIETGLPVHNVVNVRSQPGGAGTILNNLVELGVGEIRPVGFCGEDGEGFELLAALNTLPGVNLEHFLQTPLRRTFTYCKPLVLREGEPPVELSRLDSKNWSPTPADLQHVLGNLFYEASEVADAMILLDQVDQSETGVVTSDLLESVRIKAEARPGLLMMGDSRRSLKNWPPVMFKMNVAELNLLTATPATEGVKDIGLVTAELARVHRRNVFVTLSERGILGATPAGEVEHVPAFAVRGPIDVVGAGDAVTANLTAALAAGATLRESLELAMAAASVVVHQLGTTGTASVAQIRELLAV